MKQLIFGTILLPGLACATELDDTSLAKLEVGGFSKEYEVQTYTADGKHKIPYIHDFYDDLQLIRSSGRELAHKIVDVGWLQELDAVVVPGNKANAVGVMLTQILQKLRPTIKLVVLSSNSAGAVTNKASYSPVTKTKSETIYLHESQLDRLYGKNVVIIDDVISTGATVTAAKDLIEMAGGNVIGIACVATENSEFEKLAGLPVVALTEIPVIPAAEPSDDL